MEYCPRGAFLQSGCTGLQIGLRSTRKPQAIAPSGEQKCVPRARCQRLLPSEQLCRAGKESHRLKKSKWYTSFCATLIYQQKTKTLQPRKQNFCVGVQSKDIKQIAAHCHEGVYRLLPVGIYFVDFNEVVGRWARGILMRKNAKCQAVRYRRRHGDHILLQVLRRQAPEVLLCLVDKKIWEQRGW